VWSRGDRARRAPGSLFSDGVAVPLGQKMGRHVQNQLENARQTTTGVPSRYSVASRLKSWDPMGFGVWTSHVRSIFTSNTLHLLGKNLCNHFHTSFWTALGFRVSQPLLGSRLAARLTEHSPTFFWRCHRHRHKNEKKSKSPSCHKNEVGCRW
jgi:hypothetical protein